MGSTESASENRSSSGSPERGMDESFELLKTKAEKRKEKRQRSKAGEEAGWVLVKHGEECT